MQPQKTFLGDLFGFGTIANQPIGKVDQTRRLTSYQLFKRPGMPGTQLLEQDLITAIVKF